MSEPPDTHETSEEQNKKQSGDGFRVAAPYLGLGIQLAAAVIFFFFVGNWIDDRYMLSPYGKLVGALVGFVGGYIKFFRTVNELAKQQDQK